MFFNPPSSVYNPLPILRPKSAPEATPPLFHFASQFSRKVIIFVVSFCFCCLLSGCTDDGPDPLIQQAHNEWVEGRNHRAVELFKEVLKKNPSGPPAEEALFRLGEVSHFSLGNSSQAIMYFQELLQLNRKGPFAHDAQKYIAEIVEFTFKDYEQAIIEYQNLINRFDKEEEKGDHQYRIASVYFKMQNYEQALAEWEVLLDEYPDSPRAEESQFKVIEILFTLQRFSQVRELYHDFMGKYPTSKFKGEVDFILASCLEEEGELKEAHKRFKLLGESYPYPAILKTKMEGLEERMKKNKRKKRNKK
jgi:TolA-binding protein